MTCLFWKFTQIFILFFSSNVLHACCRMMKLFLSLLKSYVTSSSIVLIWLLRDARIAVMAFTYSWLYIVWNMQTKMLSFLQNWCTCHSHVQLKTHGNNFDCAAKEIIHAGRLTGQDNFSQNNYDALAVTLQMDCCIGKSTS